MEKRRLTPSFTPDRQRQPPRSQKGRMTLALRAAEQAMKTIAAAGSPNPECDSPQIAQAWLDEHAALLDALDKSW